MPTQPDLSLLPALVPEQEFLSSYVSTVLGPIEYRKWKGQLERIHELLGLSRVEETFQRLSLAQRNQAERHASEKENRQFYKWSPVEQESYQRLCSQVLRCNVARTLTGDSLRDFGCRLSDSGLLQWFCKLDRVGMEVRIPGERTAALQPVAAGSGHAEGDRHFAGGGERRQDPRRTAAGTGRGVGSGGLLSGHHVRQTAHSLSSGLGVVARRGAHIDESDDPDPQEEL